MVKYIICILMAAAGLGAQAQDSIAGSRPDTQRRVQQAVRQGSPVAQRRPVQPASPAGDSVNALHFFGRRDTLTAWQGSMDLDTAIYARHPYFRFVNPVRFGITVKQWQGKEAVFYSIVGLLMIFALIRNGFLRYIGDLFKIFFRTTVKQRQIKEQLVQSPLPSLLLNLFFLLSGGMFLALLLQYFQLGGEFNFWLLYLYSLLGLAGVYAVKFITLKFLGWIFQMSEATESYIFIVFTTNKVIGMAILPFVVILAFSQGLMSQAAVVVAITVVVGLYAYRFFLSYVTIHRQVRVSFFHFLLYLCAFEIAPLLLINKLLFRFLGETS